MHGKIGVQIQVTTCLRCAWWYDSNVWRGKLESGWGGGVAVLRYGRDAGSMAGGIDQVLVIDSFICLLVVTREALSDIPLLFSILLYRSCPRIAAVLLPSIF